MSRLTIVPEPGDVLGEKLLKRLLLIVVVYQAAALAGIAWWVVATWGTDEWTVIWIPQSVLEWSLIGAVAGALYRLSSYPKLSEQEKATLYLWVLAKPFVSTAFGCVIYLIGVGGVLMLKGDPAITHRETLAAIAFFAAFSDRFALSVLDRLLLSSGSRPPSPGRPHAIPDETEHALARSVPSSHENDGDRR